LPSPKASDPVINFAANTAVFSGSGGTLTQPIQIGPQGDLAIVTYGDLNINADIQLPQKIRAGSAPQYNIVLVSLTGKVTIAPGITVGGGQAAYGTAGTRTAVAGAGATGGKIKITGLIVDIEGSVIGNRGGHGGDVAVNSGDALSVSGGSGGDGGRISLCGLEFIRVGSHALVSGGTAGPGGNVALDVAGHASGSGGNSGDGGWVWIFGRPGTTPVQVDIAGTVEGGAGAAGGYVSVDSGNSSSVAGGFNASAYGGSGLAGGTVTFQNAVVNLPIGRVASGNGGIGGLATAVANDGGGNATAYGGGGGGGVAGPVIPLASGGRQIGVPRTSGGGGNATAISGKGGNSVFGGAASGRAIATGGLNGAGVAPPGGSVTAGPTMPAGTTGGASVTARQAGQP